MVTAAILLLLGWSFAGKWNGGRLSPGASEPVRLALEMGVIFGEFLDFQKLVFADVGEILARIAGGPPNLQVQNPC